MAQIDWTRMYIYAKIVLKKGEKNPKIRWCDWWCKVHSMVTTYFLSGYHTHPNLSRLFYCFNPDRLLEFSSKPITDRMGRGIKAKQNQKEKKETETEWLVLRKKNRERKRPRGWTRVRLPPLTIHHLQIIHHYHWW